MTSGRDWLNSLPESIERSPGDELELSGSKSIGIGVRIDLAARLEPRPPEEVPPVRKPQRASDIPILNPCLTRIKKKYLRGEGVRVDFGHEGIS